MAHPPRARDGKRNLRFPLIGASRRSDPGRGDHPVPALERHVSQATDKVPCPDCGVLFKPRGLASHRRQKHGAAAAPKPQAPGLEAVLEALARIETRLERLEQRSVAGPVAPADDLRLRLDETLAQIRAVAAEREAVEGEWADERRRACDAELGKLREQQARLLFELDELPLV